jgi:hypothetical protein
VSIWRVNQLQKVGLQIVENVWEIEYNSFKSQEVVRSSFLLEEGEKCILERMLQKLPKNGSENYIIIIKE